MEQNLNFVAKRLNPQARTIENFWGWLSQKKVQTKVVPIKS
jgi:hypothetical protein